MRPASVPVIIAAALYQHVEILRAVIERGADLDAVDNSLHTALHFGAFTNNAEVIHELVDTGANIEARDRHGRTPLHYAALGLSREALLSRLKHGAQLPDYWHPRDAVDVSSS